MWSNGGFCQSRLRWVLSAVLSLAILLPVQAQTNLFDNLKLELTTLKAQINNLKTQIDDLSLKLQKANDSSQTSQSLIKDLQAQIDASQIKINELSMSYEVQLKASAELNNQLTISTQQLEELRLSSVELNKLITRLETEKVILTVGGVLTGAAAGLTIGYLIW